jgi:hypothetical protein
MEKSPQAQKRYRKSAREGKEETERTSISSWRRGLYQPRSEIGDCDEMLSRYVGDVSTYSNVI